MPDHRITLALETPAPRTAEALALFQAVMGVLASEDRRGTKTHELTLDSPCFHILMARARKDRNVKLAQEVILGALEHYGRLRRKVGGPLRFRATRDSMPVMTEAQIQFARTALKRAGFLDFDGVVLAHNGRSLTFIASGQTPVVVAPNAKENILAIQAAPEGLYFAMSDGSGRTFTHHTPRKALLDPQFFHRLVGQIARSVRALIVHADPKLNGAPAEVLRQVYRKVRRRKAESAVALKKVGSVDRSTLLCPCCGLLVRGSRPCACGATHSQGILDAYAILEAGRDTLGSIAFLKQGEPWPQSNDAPEGGAPFATSADKDDDDDATAPTVMPSCLTNPDVNQGCEPSLKAAAAGRNAVHLATRQTAHEPVGILTSHQREESRPVEPTTPSPDPTQQAVDPQPCSPVEASIEHPRLQPWWKRLGWESRPAQLHRENMIRRAAQAADDEAFHYFRERAIRQLPVEWGLADATYTRPTLDLLVDALFQDITELAMADYRN